MALLANPLSHPRKKLIFDHFPYPVSVTQVIHFIVNSIIAYEKNQPNGRGRESCSSRHWLPYLHYVIVLPVLVCITYKLYRKEHLISCTLVQWRFFCSSRMPCHSAFFITTFTSQQFLLLHPNYLRERTHIKSFQQNTVWSWVRIMILLQLKKNGIRIGRIKGISTVRLMNGRLTRSLYLHPTSQAYCIWAIH